MKQSTLSCNINILVLIYQHIVNLASEFYILCPHQRCALCPSQAKTQALRWTFIFIVLFMPAFYLLMKISLFLYHTHTHTHTLPLVYQECARDEHIFYHIYPAGKN